MSRHSLMGKPLRIIITSDYCASLKVITVVVNAVVYLIVDPFFVTCLEYI